MRKEKKPASKAKRILGMTGLFVGIFGVTAGATFALIPQDFIEPDDPGDTPIELTGSQKLMQNIVDSVNTGLGVTVRDGLVVLNGANETSKNNFKLDGTKLKFRMDALNLHDIDLVVDAKVDYNGKNRGLGLSLVDDMIYFNVTDYDHDTWDLKYKVSTEAYDIEGVDPETGGQNQYSYGKLDWLIEDIVTILTGEGMDISFPSLGDLFNGEKNDEPSTADGGIDAQAILDSMNDMEELAVPTGVSAPHYLAWDLVLGDKTLELGLRADSDYNLSGVDFPRLSANGEQAVNAELVDDLSFKVQLDVETNNLEFGAPSDVESYHSLDNSVALFEKLAHAAGSMKFGVGLDLDLSYETEGEGKSIYQFAKDGLNDTANLSLTANVDANGMKLNNLGANLSFSHMVANEQGELESAGSQEISAYYLSGEEDAKNMLVNVNNTLRAKTTKATLDEIIGSIKDSLASDPVNDPEGASLDAKTAKQVEETESAITKAINAVKNSAFMKGLEDGVYDSALDFIKSITATDDKIEIVLTLAPLGIETGATDGKDVVITLGEDKDVDGDPLLTIEFNEIHFASFNVDGKIEVVDYTEVEAPDLGDYEDISGLKKDVDFVLDVVDAKKATIDYSVSIESDESLSIDGTAVVDASNKDNLNVGNVTHIKKDADEATPTHTIKADIFQEEVELEEEEDPFNDTRVIFSYDYTEAEEDAVPSAPVAGTISTGYAMKSVGNIMDWASNSLDNRFSRISRALAKPGENALLSDLMDGKYFALADLKLIDTFASDGDAVIVVLNGASLGFDHEIYVKIDHPTEESDYLGLVVKADINDSTTAKVTAHIHSGAKEEYLDNLDHEAKYNDYDTIFDLAEYGVATTTVGAIKHEGHGQTTLGLEANVDLVLGDYNMNAVKLDGAVSIDGVQLQAVANLNKLPTVKGLNAPESSKYFRDHEYEGSRDASFYYYADGLEENDEVMMTRDSTYGKLRNVKDSVRMSTDVFSDDVAGWLLQYLLGVDSSLLEKEDTPATASEEPAANGDSLLSFTNVLDVLTAFKGIQLLEEESDVKTFVIELNLDKLGLGFLGTTTLKIGADTVTDTEGNTFKTLTGLNAEVDLALAGKLQIAKAVIDLSLTNLTGGAYKNIWNATDQKGYFTYFCPTVGELEVYGEPEAYGYVSTDGIINRNYKITETGRVGNYYVL